MTVRAHAVASLSPDRTVFSCFLSCKSQCFCTSSSRLPVFKRAYSREFLLDVGRITFLVLNSVHAEELRDLGLLRRPTPSPTPTTASRPQRRLYKRRERKQKRGKRRGIRARLAANPHPLVWLYDSFSSPPVAGVLGGALAPLCCGCHCIIQVDAAHWWWLKRDPLI